MYYNINHSAGKIKLKNELNVLKLFFFLLCSTATCAYTSIKVKWSKSKHDTHCDWHFKYKLEKELTYRLFEWGNRRLQIVRSLFKKVTSQHKLRGYESLWTGNNLLVPNEWGGKKPKTKQKKHKKKILLFIPITGTCLSGPVVLICMPLQYLIVCWKLAQWIYPGFQVL